MKRLTVFLLAVMLLVCAAIPCAAEAPEKIDFSYRDTLVISPSFARTSERTGTKTRTFTYKGDTIAEISLTATFRYNGSSVSVVSKSVSDYTTYNGWSYQQSSLTSSGGTATLTGKLKKGLLNANVNFSISCDASGNIS